MDRREIVAKLNEFRDKYGVEIGYAGRVIAWSEGDGGVGIAPERSSNPIGFSYQRHPSRRENDLQEMHSDEVSTRLWFGKHPNSQIYRICREAPKKREGTHIIQTSSGVFID